MNFQWIGGPTFVLEFGDFRLLTDPIFAQGPAAFVMNGHPSTGQDQVAIARLAPLPDFDLQPLDCVLLSHLHSDHFDQVASQSLDRSLLFIASPELAPHLREREFENFHPLAWWQELTLTKNGQALRIVALPARHSQDDQTNRDLGTVNGYLLQYTAQSQSLSLYWTGDTVWFDDLVKIKDAVGKVDLLVPHLGAVGQGGPWGMMTLDAHQAVRLVELFDPAVVVPIHHHTFSHYVEPVSLFQDALGKSKNGSELIVLREGDKLDLKPSKPA